MSNCTVTPPRLESVWTTGNICWAPHVTKAFVRAIIEKVDGGQAVVHAEKPGAESWTCEVSGLLACPPESKCVANMDELPELNMAEVLENVGTLYNRKQNDTPGNEPWSSIYSSVGPVLIAMNPFAELPLYGEAWIRAFTDVGNRSAIDNAWRTLGPHCYGTIEAAFQGLRRRRQQSVIICGESGAGKTVTNRKMLEYMLDAEEKGFRPPYEAVANQEVAVTDENGITVETVPRGQQVTVVSIDGEQAQVRWNAIEGLCKAEDLEWNGPSVLRKFSRTVSNEGLTESMTWASSKSQPQIMTRSVTTRTDSTMSERSRDKAAEKRKIAEANDLLESFGNAKTLRNDNSSRFGKYSQLHFDAETYKITGFEIEHYLLERSRVVFEPEGERNYHVFHQLLRSEKAKEYKLYGGPGKYEFTKRGSNVLVADGESSFEDAKDFDAVLRKMEIIGFSESERDRVFAAIAAVLHLGSVEFVDGAGGESCDTSEDSKASLDAACDLLGIRGGANILKIALVLKKAEEQNVRVSFKVQANAEAARANRDSVAKVLYSRIFDHLLVKINSTLNKRTRMAGRTSTAKATVGLLDIFGFEDMPSNGLEQMYINLTNERIQYIFNDVMVNRELAAYSIEGITLDGIFDTEQISNWPCIDLFISTSAKLGMVRLLSDACKQSLKKNMDDKDFLAILNKQMKIDGRSSASDSTGPKPYVQVEGQMIGSLNQVKRKRWGRLAIDLRYGECFQIKHYAGDVTYSVNDFVAKSKDALPQHLERVLFDPENPDANPNAAPLQSPETSHKDGTIGEKFVRQLQLLTEKLDSGSNLFVRCIKPNPEGKPDILDRPYVLDQLNNGGVVKALEMRRAGYPDRREYSDFMDEFWILRCGARQTTRTCRQQCEDVLLQNHVDRGQYDYGIKKLFMRSGVLDGLRKAVVEKISRFALKVQRRWRFKKRCLFIHEVIQAKKQLDVAKKSAACHGFSDFKLVKDVFREADVVRKAIQELWLESRIEPRKIPELRKARSDLSEVVETVAKKKARAEALLEDCLNEKWQQSNDLLDRVVVIEQFLGIAATASLSSAIEENQENEDAKERVACIEACKIARGALETEAPKVLSDLQATGLNGIDFSMDWTPLDPAPAGTAVLSRASALVDEAETRKLAYSRSRVNFEGESRELQAKCESGRVQLEKLQTACKEEQDAGSAEGINASFTAEVTKAWRLLGEKDDIYQAGLDLDAYKDAATNFLEAVKTLQTHLGEARKKRRHISDEKERRRREALERTLGSTQDWRTLRDSGVGMLRMLKKMEDTEDHLTDTEELALKTKLQQLRESLCALGINEAPAQEDQLPSQPSSASTLIWDDSHGQARVPDNNQTCFRARQCSAHRINACAGQMQSVADRCARGDRCVVM